MFYIALVIFLLVEGLIVYSAFRYRRKPGDDELPPQIHGNNLVEIVWTLIPTVIVVVLFVFSWQTLNVVDATVKTDVHVRAVAARFQWSFEYLDGPATDAHVLFKQIITTGEDEGLTLPVGVPITVDLRSEDVIHAFYVPKFLFKRDVVPGKNNTFDFTIDDPGTYRGQCAELCGTGHAAMLFDVNAVDKPTFDAWLQKHIDEAAATPPPPPSGGPSAAPARARRRRASPPARLVDLAAQNIAYTTDALLGAGRRRRSRSTSTTRTRASRTTSRSRTPPARRSSRAPDHHRAGEAAVRRAGARRRHLPVRLLGPSEHDRHPHGPVGAGMATTTLHPAIPGARSTPVRVADDHRPQEDRDPVPDQLDDLLLLGGILALVVRLQLVIPKSDTVIGGLVSPEFYNQVFTMHASFMLFLFIIPVLAGFGNYAVPLQIGAPDMAFPRINALSFWLLPLGGLLMASASSSRAAPRRRAGRSTRRCPGRSTAGTGTDLWIVGLILIGTSSILGGINFLVTIFKMRAPGMTLFRMPIFVWTILVTSVLVVMATPVLTSVLIMLFIDRNYGGHFFDPANGGNAVL